jgi:hypothetical protein
MEARHAAADDRRGWLKWQRHPSSPRPDGRRVTAQREIDQMFYPPKQMARRCQRSANVAYYARNRSFEIERVRVRQHGAVEMLRELRARPCMDCGITYEPHQMDFDHREGTVKRFRLTEGGASLRPTSDLLDEAAKCHVVCANCHRIRTQRRHAARSPSAIGVSDHAERKRRNAREQAALLDRLRGQPCQDCGGRFAPGAMDFDHREPGSKRSAVTRMVGRAGTERILAEVAKCDIVCANCHRLRTFVRRSMERTRE